MDLHRVHGRRRVLLAVGELDLHECTISVDVEGGGAGLGSVRPGFVGLFQRRPTTR